MGAFISDDEELASLAEVIDRWSVKMTDTPTEQPETTIERQVDTVIDHLGKGRVVPRKVDELAGAVARARTDGAVGRAIGSRDTR